MKNLFYAIFYLSLLCFNVPVASAQLASIDGYSASIGSEKNCAEVYHINITGPNLERFADSSFIEKIMSDSGNTLRDSLHEYCLEDLPRIAFEGRYGTFKFNLGMMRKKNAWVPEYTAGAFLSAIAPRSNGDGKSIINQTSLASLDDVVLINYAAARGYRDVELMKRTKNSAIFVGKKLHIYSRVPEIVVVHFGGWTETVLESSTPPKLNDELSKALKR